MTTKEREEIKKAAEKAAKQWEFEDDMVVVALKNAFEEGAQFGRSQLAQSIRGILETEV